MSNPELLVRFVSIISRAQHNIGLREGQSVVVGSASSSCPLSGEGVEAAHLLLFLEGGELFVEPAEGATTTLNGTPVTAATRVNDGDWLLLGQTAFQVRLVRPEPQAQTAVVGDATATAPLDFHFGSDATPTVQPGITAPPSQPPANQVRPGLLTVGRQPQCDLTIPSPLVSREHARLEQQPGGWVVKDCQSTNGTFLNGHRVQGQAPLQPGDRLGFAAFEYVFAGDRLEPVTQAGRVHIEVRRLTKEVRDKSGKSKKLLDDISLVIESGEFVVIFGTSGSGKSTLLDALNGRRPATGGCVLYNGTDLYAAFDLYRSAIGYVPQQDIVHRKIAVERALDYTAQLRLPPDTSEEEMHEHVIRVLDKVGLAEKAALAIDTPAPLSGGQLKRVSLAVELVANPNVLFLDEVTSGLDAGTDKRMMQLFRELADDHKTVVCVTHSLENIDACHLVVLLHQGRLVFFGPPQAVAGYFGISKLSDVYELLESRPAAEWAEKYRASNFFNTYVLQRLQSATDEDTLEAVTASPLPRAHWFDWRQSITLMRRYVDLMLSDRRNLLILILQAPLIALVVGLVFEIDQASMMDRVAKESQISFILVLSAIWFGCLNSARELVKELPIYLRERSVNLGLAPYITSKLLPLAGLCMLQCGFLLAVATAMVSIPGDVPMRFAVLFAASMAATAMGLSVSAFVNSNDKAVATVPILLIPQVILSGAVVKLKGTGLLLAKASMISYWAFDAMKATLSAEVRTAKDFQGQLLLSLHGQAGEDLQFVVALGLAFLAAAVLGLKLKDRK